MEPETTPAVDSTPTSEAAEYIQEGPPPSNAPPEDPTLEFDQSRKTRQDALTAAYQVLQKANNKEKLGQKDLIKALQNLTSHAVHLDQLTVILLQEMYRIVQAVAGSEVTMFSLGANLKAVIRGLDQKNLVKEAEFEKIFREEVLPNELPKDFKMPETA